MQAQSQLKALYKDSADTIVGNMDCSIFLGGKEPGTLKELAAALGNPKASRAVGSACHRNPLCIVVPCHRVIGADGSLTGYAEGLDIKEYLLELERF